MQAPTFLQYHQQTICSAKTDLGNPRSSFAQGFNDFLREREAGQLRDMSAHYNPWYAAGYNHADWAVEAFCWPIKQFSELDWNRWHIDLSDQDYETLCRSMLESSIRFYEYLFHEKQERNTFSEATWEHIFDRFSQTVHYKNAAQLRIINKVFQDFHLA